MPSSSRLADEPASTRRRPLVSSPPVPTGPMPPEIAAFLAAPRPAVVATTRADGSPLTAATWYLMEAGHVLLSMGPDGARARNLRRDGRFSLTVLAANWYSQV